MTLRGPSGHGKPGESVPDGPYHRAMRSPVPLALRPAVGDFDTTSAGPAMTVLDTLIIRITVLLRGIALAEMVVQVIIWHSFYLASPWLLWGPAVALVWGCTSIAYLRRHRPRWRFICADTAVRTHAEIEVRLACIFATDDAPDRPALSAQETRTLRLYATGMPIKSVARRLGISEETAKQHVRRVREKYAQAGRAAPTKVDLYHRAVEDGHLPFPP